MTITIRRLGAGDVETITAAFTAVGWPGKDAAPGVPEITDLNVLPQRRRRGSRPR